MEKEDDLPRSMIVILVVLAVAISVLGTFTVVSEMKSINTAPTYKGQNATTAKVRFEVIDRNEMATGKITFEFIKTSEDE